MLPKAEATKEKINTLDFIEIKTFVYQTDIIKKIKNNPQTGNYKSYTSLRVYHLEYIKNYNVTTKKTLQSNF